MLIEFRVSNFRSVLHEQTLSLVKAEGDQLLSNTVEVNGANKLQLLKSSVLYGANASGKSNFLKALAYMRQVVVTSSQRGNALPITPFKLNNISVESPSEFEASFIVNNVRYQYGFSATDEQVIDEWLFAYPKGRAQKWFERVWDSEEKKHVYSFSSNLAGKKLVWQDSTRSNALFLSTAVQLNSEQLKPVFDWFKNTLHFVGIDGCTPQFSAQSCLDGNQEKILGLLKTADFHIDDLQIKPEDLSSILPDQMPNELKELLIKEMKGSPILDIRTIHRNNLGEKIAFDFKEESDGTQRFFSLSGPLFDVLLNGRVLIVDELDSSLHPELVKFLVNIFHDKAWNVNNAQLIFSTHDTSILNGEVFRRDQIWFCQKDREEQFTKLYSLSDFKPLKGEENLEAFYLSGKFGALPFIDDFFMEK